MSVEVTNTDRFRPRVRGLARLLVLVAAGGLAVTLGGCGSGGAESADWTPSPAMSGEPTGVGSLSLALNVGNSSINTAAYTIIGNQFHTSGTIDVSRSTVISSTIGGIPFGTNYVVTLTATSAAGPSTTCDGSASFDVANETPVQVPVNVECKEQTLVAATPAPIPPFAPIALCLALLGLGLLQQKRSSAI